MDDLTDKHCEPCEGGIEPMSLEEAQEHREQVEEWTLQNENSSPRIRREFHLADFVTAIDFVNELAELAEDEGHHPTLIIDYDTVTVTLWTHAVEGLTENDFILAAKYDELAENYT